MEEYKAIDDGLPTKMTMEQNREKKLVSSLSAREERAFKSLYCPLDENVDDCG